MRKGTVFSGVLFPLYQSLKEEKKNCPKKYGWDRPDFVEQIGKRQV
jgi:hypothetical protein